MSEGLSKQGPRPRPLSFGGKKTTQTSLKSDSKESRVKNLLIILRIERRRKKEKKEKYIWDESTLVNAAKSFGAAIVCFIVWF